MYSLKFHHRLTFSHLNMILMPLNLYKDLFIEWKISPIFLALQESPTLMEVTTIGSSTLVQENTSIAPLSHKKNLAGVPKSRIKLRCTSLMQSLILLYGHLSSRWYITRLVVLQCTPKRHVLLWDQTMCSKNRHHSRFDRQHNWEGLCDHFKRKRIFTLTICNCSISIPVLKFEITILVIHNC